MAAKQSCWLLFISDGLRQALNSSTKANITTDAQVWQQACLCLSAAALRHACTPHATVSKLSSAKDPPHEVMMPDARPLAWLKAPRQGWGAQGGSSLLAGFVRVMAGDKGRERHHHQQRPFFSRELLLQGSGNVTHA